MLAITRFSVPDDAAADFEKGARELLDLLAAQPGYVTGRLSRAVDDPSVWALVTEWEGAGFYRRSMSPYEVRIAAMTLMSRAIDEAGAFEVLHQR
ncbi:antibiotic biosynthesis monooxygenase family protein [Bailinhaonella thermotolerans]|uniref:Antibiotic biosynthesis monooxygenase n=1 Tax=Bailinhaonella thermotolerans TaxID=1070861 RepID=A0A3A4A0K9_9ACTN|nr:antibiotic biosynthesis monooxygenase family protein [Bailinhaonella thermotolerans]RJL21463.1 antibiotic biosynthesis monooxygenase [Bailinhaonella thermotolerans]